MTVGLNRGEVGRTEGPNATAGTADGVPWGARGSGMSTACWRNFWTSGNFWLTFGVTFGLLVTLSHQQHHDPSKTSTNYFNPFNGRCVWISPVTRDFALEIPLPSDFALCWSYGAQSLPIFTSRCRELGSAVRFLPFPLKTQFRKIDIAKLSRKREKRSGLIHSNLSLCWGKPLRFLDGQASY